MSLKSFKTSYDNIFLNKGIKLSNLKLNFASLSFSIVAIEPDCYQRIPQKFNYPKSRFCLNNIKVENEFLKVYFPSMPLGSSEKLQLIGSSPCNYGISSRSIAHLSPFRLYQTRNWDFELGLGLVLDNKDIHDS